MNILNLISTLGHGRGGHFYDLTAVTGELQKHSNLITVNICKNESEVLNKAGIELMNLKFTVFNFFSVYSEINKIIKEREILVINCYDLNALSFANVLAIGSKVKVIYTKCGGPNPSGYYPKISNLILMSEENAEFFERNEKYRDTHKVVLPNRVDVLRQDPERIKKVKGLIPDGVKVIMRISRITKHYESTLKQSVNVFNELSKTHQDIFLLIVGVVQNESLLKELQEMIQFPERAVILTDNYYTLNASELLPVADLTVGTGRGVMEAAFFNKKLLTSLKGSQYPVLIEKENFAKLFSTNFSPRNELDVLDEASNLEKIEKVLYDVDFAKENLTFVQEIFDEYFNIKSVPKKYFDFFEKANRRRAGFYDLLRLSLSMIKKFMQAQRC